MTGRHRPGAEARVASREADRPTGAGSAPSRAVVEAVAEAADRDPTALEPLYDAIDPDALDALVSSRRGSSRSDLRISFTYASFEVTVGPAGAVEVRSVGERIEAE